MRGVEVVAVALACLGCASTGRETIVLHPEGLLQITGTFTDLRVERDRGVFGAEVRIVCSQDPSYQAIIQFGSGSFCEADQLGSEPCFQVSNLILVEAQFDWEGNTENGAFLRLRLPEESGYAGVFTGHITEQALTGTFDFISGYRLPVTLRRGASHWDGDGSGVVGGRRTRACS